MRTLLHYIDAYGTSEGVIKEWESRRRTENVLKGHGWHSKMSANEYTHRIHTEHSIFVRPNGSWLHVKHAGGGSEVTQGEGSNYAALNKHLLTQNWGGKMGKHRN